MKKGTCVHFNGIQNTCCDAGVRYDDLTTKEGEKYALQIPCFLKSINPKDTRPRAECDKYKEPTAKQIRDWQAVIKASMDRFEKALPLMMKIKKEHKGKSWRGTVKCPVCQGKLHVSHAAYNGHVHAHCETKGCLSFME